MSDDEEIQSTSTEGSTFSSGEDEVEENVPTMKSKVDVPSNIDLNCMVVEIAFHPEKNVIAAGTIDGPVKIYSYTTEKSKSNHKLMTFKHHKESCRAVQFSHSGDYLFTGSSDTTIQAIDLNTGAVTRRLSTKNGAAIYCLLPIDNYLLASGDDNGKLMVWDFRRQTPIMSEKACNEYISSLVSSSNKRTLLATSGEGILVAFNVRARKMELQSELFNAEFLTAAIIKNESKVVVGAGDGAINIFNWGEWGNISDRFPGHPGSIDTMAQISDNIVCTGCEDGQIRVVQFFPNKIHGKIGTHDNFPVEGLTVSHDNKFLASCSYDQQIKFYDLTCIEEITETTEKPSKKDKTEKLNFFADLA